MSTFAGKIISFCSNIDFNGSLPPGISLMNPYRDNPGVMPAIIRFYQKYYNDNRSRHLILGINPGRFGAGVTGIPFTDSVRLKEKCGIWPLLHKCCLSPGIPLEHPRFIMQYRSGQKQIYIDKYMRGFRKIKSS